MIVNIKAIKKKSFQELLYNTTINRTVKIRIGKQNTHKDRHCVFQHYQCKHINSLD